MRQGAIEAMAKAITGTLIRHEVYWSAEAALDALLDYLARNEASIVRDMFLHTLDFHMLLAVLREDD